MDWMTPPRAAWGLWRNVVLLVHVPCVCMDCLWWSRVVLGAACCGVRVMAWKHLAFLVFESCCIETTAAIAFSCIIRPGSLGVIHATITLPFLCTSLVRQLRMELLCPHCGLKA